MLSFPSASAGSLPRCVRSALLLFCTLTGLCLLTELFCHFVLHLRRPYDWPLPSPENRFCDFLVYYPRMLLIHSPDFFTKSGIGGFSYPPAAAAVLSVFYLTPNPLAAFLAAMMLCILGAGFLFRRILLRSGLSAGAAIMAVLFFGFSYPLMLTVQQGNCEWIVCLILAAGLASFLGSRPALAAILLGLGAAIKLYPIILLGLFLHRRQYRWVVTGLGMFVLFTVASLWWESGSISLSWAGTISGISGLNSSYVRHSMFFWDHSLFEFFKGAVAFAHPAKYTSQKSERVYILAMAVIGTVLFFARIRKMPTLNQIFALVTASILLPPMSMDYTIIQLFLPCALLILSAIRSAQSGLGPSSKGTHAALLTLGFLFAPLTELTVYGHTLSNTLRTLGLVTLFVISIRYPMEFAEQLEPSQSDAITEARLAA